MLATRFSLEEFCLRKAGKRTQPVAGFTLVETLVVLAITAILVGLTVTAVGPLLRGNDLTAGGQQVIGVLSEARQIAITQNHTVEVRIYDISDPSINGGTAFYRAMRPVLVESNGTVDTPPVVLAKTQTLARDITCLSSSTWSTLIGTPVIHGTEASVGPYQNVPYVAFRILPDGSLSIPAGQWTLTLAMVQNQMANTAQPPNFFMVQIDANTGRLSTYRP